MNSDFTEFLSNTISIPSAVHERALADLFVSVRLWNVLQSLGIQKLGDLHEMSYRDVFAAKNCGRNTIFELRDCVERIWSSEDFQSETNFPIRVAVPAAKETKKSLLETIYIPQEARGLPLSSFPFSTRLSNVLRNFEFRLLGDLQGMAYDDFERSENCGNKTIFELKEFIEKIQSGDLLTNTSAAQSVIAPTILNLKTAIEFIENFIAELPVRDQEILGLRFGGVTGTPQKLEEIGRKYGLTRERVRQIENRIVKNLKRRLGDGGENFFKQLSRDCLFAICPLTPQLIVYRTGRELSDFRFLPSFYARLLAELSADIPVLPDGQVSEGQPRSERASEICREIKSLLSRNSDAIPLKDVFNDLRNSIQNLGEREFLDALQFNNHLALVLDLPDNLAIKLTARRKAEEIAFQVLSESDRPLTPEEIVARAKEKFGEDTVSSSPRSLNNLMYYAEGFYLLDNRAIGLRKHFRLPPERWSELRDDFFNLLRENKRSFSTPDVIARRLFSWTDAVNSSEAAAILREDARFTDLGRFHFALAEWDVEEREKVQDLILKVLNQASEPLSATEIANRIQNLRSITPTSMSSILRQRKAVKDYGFGFYGLIEWADERREFLVANKAFVNRAVARSQPPLTFGDLCRKLEIEETGNLADKLWRTLRGLPKLRFKPNASQSPETVLVHTNWQFDRAVQKVLAQAERPLSVYEIQWELNRVFGKTFDEKKLDAIKNCLQNDELFIRNSQGAFLLREQLEESDLDADSICQACFWILSEENAVLSVSDLIEKLNDEDLSDADLSAEILAALLRGDSSNFEEVGTNLFRVKR
jgi:hypothetical protein